LDNSGSDDNDSDSDFNQDENKKIETKKPVARKKPAEKPIAQKRKIRSKKGFKTSNKKKKSKSTQDTDTSTDASNDRNKTHFKEYMKVWNLPSGCDSEGGKNAMIAFITKFKGLEESVAVIHKFEKTYSRQKNSILRDGVSCFNPNIVKQKDFALDFMNFPPDGKNNSFGLQTGANGSFAIRNPCINLMNKTTMMALQSLGFVTPSAVENRMNSLIVFDVHPFRYPSNCFSGGPKTIPLPEFLKDENQQSAQRDFENVLTHWKQICTEVVKHLEEKSEGKVQVTEFGSYARTRFTDGIKLTREANQSCHPHYILASYVDEKSQMKFIKSIYCTMGDNEQVNLQSVVEGFSVSSSKRC